MENLSYQPVYKNNILCDNLFFETKFSPCKSHPYIFWFLLSLLLVGLSLLLFFLQNEAVFILTAMPLAITLFLVPCGIKLGVIVMNNWAKEVRHFIIYPEQDVQTWFQNQGIVFEGTKGMIIWSLLVSVIALATFLLAGAFSNLNIFSSVALSLILLSSGFFAGVALYCLFCLGRVIWRFGRFSLKVHAHPFGVMTTGQALLKCYFIAAIIWCIYTSSATVGLAAEWIPMISLAVPSVIFFIVSFIVCQLPIHNKMVDFKRVELDEIEKTLESLIPKKLDELTQERRNQIEFIEKKRTEIIALPEWPFGWKSLLVTGLSGITSVLPTIISLSKEAFKLYPISTHPFS
jgi:hypothetical protein